jgi:hypothetical protein
MKLSEIQAILLLDIAKDTLKIPDDFGMIFHFDKTKRTQLVNEILKQQDKTLKNLEELK